MYRPESPARWAAIPLRPRPEDATDDQRRQIRRKPAQKRTDCKQGHAAHVKILAPDDRGKPTAQRQHDGVRNKIRSEHPRALILPGRKTASDVRQRDVGDGSVEHLHERRQRHRQRDDPRIDRRTPGIAPDLRGGGRTHSRIQTLGVTDIPGRNCVIVVLLPARARSSPECAGLLSRNCRWRFPEAAS